MLIKKGVAGRFLLLTASLSRTCVFYSMVESNFLCDNVIDDSLKKTPRIAPPLKSRALKRIVRTAILGPDFSVMGSKHKLLQTSHKRCHNYGYEKHEFFCLHTRNIFQFS